MSSKPKATRHECVARHTARESGGNVPRRRRAASPRRGVEIFRFALRGRRGRRRGRRSRAVVDRDPDGVSSCSTSRAARRLDWAKAHLGKAPDALASSRRGITCHIRQGPLSALRVKESGEARVTFGAGQATYAGRCRGLVLCCAIRRRSPATASRTIGSEFVIGKDAQLVHARLAGDRARACVSEDCVTVGARRRLSPALPQSRWRADAVSGSSYRVERRARRGASLRHDDAARHGARRCHHAYRSHDQQYG